MASFNRVILVGNVTRDLELRYIPSGTAVTDIGLAVSDRRKNASGEWVEETTSVRPSPSTSPIAADERTFPPVGYVHFSVQVSPSHSKQ